MEASILCVIDFSDSSRNTLQWAITKAYKLKTHLTILFPYRLTRPPNGKSIASMKKEIEDEAILSFKSFEKDLLLDKGISYDFKSEVGFVGDRVDDHIKNNEIKFLVIDKNMRFDNKESFDYLVDRSQIPLVIVP
jgi:hypothetical protein